MDALPRPAFPIYVGLGLPVGVYWFVAHQLDTVITKNKNI